MTTQTVSEPIVVQKNSTEEIRIRAQTLYGRDVVDVRVWTDPAGNGDRVPTRKGVCFRRTLLPKVIAALQEISHLNMAASLESATETE